MAQFCCEICDKDFTLNRNLRAHLKQVHLLCDEEVESRAPKTVCIYNTRECVICKTRVGSDYDSLAFHYGTHNVSLKKEELTFTNESSFLAWKAATERSTCSQFFKTRGSKSNRNGETTVFYKCSRSGRYESKGKGLRHLKSTQSRKIGGTCPAEMCTTITENGGVHVKFIETHVGHGMNDLGHLTVSKDFKLEVAARLSQKIPAQVVLEDMRERASSEKICRESLLTLKDVRNIKNAFHVNLEHLHHTNDALSVEAFVKNDEMSCQPCVLFYKGQSVLSDDFPFLRKDDFVMVIMNQAQGELLLKYGSDVICMDTTHGLRYDCKLTTILVVDDHREGFPCAFLVSNRSDTETLRVFVERIFAQVGGIVPNVFMSDMDPALYSAWSDIMGPVGTRLYCSWHVIRAWELNIKQKVEGKELQHQCSVRLRAILEETDEETFLTMEKSFIAWCKVECQQFSSYFLQMYVGKEKQWAFCYRVRSGINTNMHLERFHRTVKYFCMKGLQNHRLDETLHVLMKFIRHRLYERLVTLYKGKVTRKVANIRQRHQASLEMALSSIVQLDESSWNVRSSRGLNFYKVEKLLENCSCQLVCQKCNVCIHAFSCECIDSAIKWNLCKHVHLLCRYLQNSASTECRVVEESERGTLTRALVPPQRSSLILEEAKSAALAKFMNNFNSIKSMEELHAVERVTAQISPLLSAMRNASGSSHNLIATDSKSPSSWNKRVVPQKRFFTVKKGLQRKKVMKKPSSTEVAAAALSMVMEEKMKDTDTG